MSLNILFPGSRAFQTACVISPPSRVKGFCYFFSILCFLIGNRTFVPTGRTSHFCFVFPFFCFCFCFYFLNWDRTSVLNSDAPTGRAPIFILCFPFFCFCFCFRFLNWDRTSVLNSDAPTGRTPIFIQAGCVQASCRASQRLDQHRILRYLVS